MTILDSIMSHFGYLPVAKVNQELHRRDEITRELRHKVRDLQHQQLYRGLLERELLIMREIATTRNQQEIEKSVQKLDNICDELKSLIPANYRFPFHLEPDSADIHEPSTV